MRLFCIYVVFCLLLNHSLSFSQNKEKLDSLYDAYSSAAHDTIAVATLIRIGEQYLNTNPDSSLQVFSRAKSRLAKNTDKSYMASFLEAWLLQKQGVAYKNKSDFSSAMMYINKSLRINKNIDNKEGIFSSYLNIGNIYKAKGESETAVEYYNKALAIAEELNKDRLKAKCLHNMGDAYTELGNFPQALNYLQLALRYREKINDKAAIAGTCLNISRVHEKQKNIDSAIEYIKKALEIFRSLNDKKNISTCVNNLGSIYDGLKKYREALTAFETAFKIFEEMGDKKSMATCLANIAGINVNTGKTKEGEAFYQKAMSIAEKIGDKSCSASILINWGSAKIKEKDYVQALEYCSQGLEISNAINNLQYRKIALEGLSWACAGQGRFKEAYNYYVQFKNVNDSIYNIEKNKQITLAEAQYQNEKKQLLIKNQESELAMQSEKMKKQKILIYSFIVGILVILIFSILLYRQFRQKKMANIMLERKNHMIQLQNKEISAQKDEIQSQRDLVTQQKNQIEIIHKELTDSIHYACRIQQAVLPEDVLLQEILASHFILFKPRDVVSGDFYWCTILKNYLIFAVADCTGHGVPGAFMSMIGVTFLNEIVSKIDIPDPAFILNALRQNIIRALHQQGTVGEQKDGMDIALVILDLVPEPIWIENGECKEIFHVKFAGANNPLVIVKKATLPVSQETNPAIAGENNPCQMIEIAANSMPIGIYDKMDEFVNREIQINKGDMLYVFSDGFSDQFGGPKGKKFMSKKLKGLLVSIAPKPVDEQKEILDKTIEEWKAHINSYTHEPFEQTDDITVMGVRL